MEESSSRLESETGCEKETDGERQREPGHASTRAKLASTGDETWGPGGAWAPASVEPLEPAGR